VYTLRQWKTLQNLSLVRPAPVQNLEFFKSSGTCASAKPQNFLDSAPVQKWVKSKKLVVSLRQHYNLPNLDKSSPSL
jgi:hypothetical protein